VAPKGLDANAWIDAAQVAILEGGLAAVGVEPLARRLGVTKGSFYWHFTDRDALLTAMVERWAIKTEALISEAEFLSSPQARLEALVVAVHRSAEGVRTMRAMSALASHPALAERVCAVAQRRHGFLSACFVGMGLGQEHAEAAARLIHAASLGVGELQPLGVGFASEAERRLYIETLLELVRSFARVGAKPAKRKAALRD
jgi:AcrR family transcriptional regulator